MASDPELFWVMNNNDDRRYRLACHADSIYHLKEGSLNQQMTELQQLHQCLKQQQEKDSEVLEHVEHVSFQPCEGG